MLPALFRQDQVCLLQQIQMIRNARFADAEPVGDLAGGQVAFPEEIQDAASGRIVECAK